jgi:hypothetical protein
LGSLWLGARDEEVCGWGDSDLTLEVGALIIWKFVVGVLVIWKFVVGVLVIEEFVIGCSSDWEVCDLGR